MQILIEEKAKRLIAKLREENGDIIFYKSFGCCEGSSVHCFRVGDFKLGTNDIILAQNEDLTLYSQRSQDFGERQLRVSTKPGNSNEYSLEFGLGESFSFDFIK